MRGASKGATSNFIDPRRLAIWGVWAAALLLVTICALATALCAPLDHNEHMYVAAGWLAENAAHVGKRASFEYTPAS